jgi:hypothetical protein
VRILLQEGKSAKTCLDIVLLSKAFVRKGCFMTLPAVFAENTLMIQYRMGGFFSAQVMDTDAYQEIIGIRKSSYRSK